MRERSRHGRRSAQRDQKGDSVSAPRDLDLARTLYLGSFRRTITLQDHIWREGSGDEWVTIEPFLDELPAAAPPTPPDLPAASLAQ